MNKNIWSVNDNFNVRSDVGEADKLDTIVHQFPTNERNTASLQIEEESLESIFSKSFEGSNLSKRMNLANSLSIDIPKLVHFGHPPIATDNIGNLLDGIGATIIENSNGIWRRTYRDNGMANTHDVETISEKRAYRKHIRDSEFETRKVFERKTSNINIKNILTQLDKTQLDNNQMTQSTDSSKQSEMYELGSNPDPEPLSSDSSESSSSESRASKKKLMKKKKRRKHRKDDSSDPSSSDDYDSSDDIYYRRK